MVTNVDRTMTDVVFPESFIFESEPDDFCVEITLYAARTDLGLSDGGGSLRTKITRSLGRRFGGQVKTSLNTTERPDVVRGDTAVGGTHFNMLARAYLVLTDAGDECKIHDLKISAFADLSGPPLYGHVLCRLAVQPNSVLRPLAEGMLSIKPLCGGRILRNVRTRLQAGNLHCFTNSDIHQCPSAEQTLLLVPITSTSRVLATSLPNTLLLSSDNTDTVEGYDFYITTESYKTMIAWKKAIEMQIDDCAVWGEFAYRPTKLTLEKPTDPVKETIGRISGSRLYDKINIAGSLSRNNGLPSKALCHDPVEHSSLMSAQTAPIKRHKNRANVLGLFEKSKQTPVSDAKPQTSWRSPPSGEVHKCVIEVDNDNGYGRIHSGSLPSTQPVTLDEPSVHGQSPASRLRYRDTALDNVKSNDVNSANSGTKSWSRSLGASLGKKIQTYPVEVTRL
ncbi:hypothetical protein KIN20_029272 [Parelaphostrongylus tenuis]|uniref:Anillin homology domain-containing protein n=1 Tax=Parelaphostrongylus tenuis TaxID=148309 RepID=A0AAD5R231_PARTN|nr:hypothetical protein KIN20_029272 [Parelaphostrongylus tenuis]